MRHQNYLLVCLISGSIAAVAGGTRFSEAQEAAFHGALSDQPSAPVIETEVCVGPWERLHGFLFRRYAGSVEMESKTPYPKGYFGRYTYLPWKPDWVDVPSNTVRQSQYGHYSIGQKTKAGFEVPPVIGGLPTWSNPTPLNQLQMEPLVPGRLHDIEVVPAQ